MAGKLHRFLFGPLSRAVVIIVFANFLFLALMVAAPSDPDVLSTRIRTAFEMGELGLADYLPFDRRHGMHQYNDCNVLQMLSNPDPSRLKRALAPIIYKADEHFNDACPVLHALVLGAVDRDTLLSFRYARYWHGYNVLTALGLRVMELKELRRGLSGAVWFAIGVLAVATYRAGPCTRRVGYAIALAAALVWAVPYFAPGLTHGPGDALLLLALAPIATRPRLAIDLNTIVPYAAGFGATVVFFEMLTGQLPTAVAWLTALTLAAARDEERPEGVGAPVVALAAFIGFGLGAAATVLVKQILAFALAEPNAGIQFLAQLRQYMGVPSSEGSWPGILVPFGALIRASSILTYGHKLAGYGLIATIVLTWFAAAMRGWRRRNSDDGRDVLIIVSAALIPVAWVLVMPRHTDIHAGFMVRMLVVPISLAPLAVFWPPLREVGVWPRALPRAETVSK
jgi:hypothetical protein